MGDRSVRALPTGHRDFGSLPRQLLPSRRHPRAFRRFHPTKNNPAPARRGAVIQMGEWDAGTADLLPTHVWNPCSSLAVNDRVSSRTESRT